MKKIFAAITSLVLSVASFAVLAPVMVSAAAPYTCTWTGAIDSSFSNAGNWSGCNSAAPVASDNDNLIFNGSATSFTPNNNITGLTVGNITFAGSSSYTIVGNGFTVTGGITDNSTGTTPNAIQTDVTFTGSQNITGTQAVGLNFGVFAGSNTFTISSGTLTVASGYAGQLNVNAALAGSGTLAINARPVHATATSSTFTGPINVASGASLYGSPTNIGTGAITVASGGFLDLQSATNATLSNALTIAGTGGLGGEALFSSVGPNCAFTCTATDTLTLAGPVTLTGNTTFDPSGGTINITGTYTSGGFKLTAASGKIVIGSTVISGNGTSITGAKAKTPNTGFSVIKGQPYMALVGTLLVGGVVLMIARSSHKAVRGRR